MACSNRDTVRAAPRSHGSGDACVGVSAVGREALLVFKGRRRYRGARWRLHGARCLCSADAAAEGSGSRSPRRSYPRTTAIARAANGVVGRLPRRTLGLSRNRFASSGARRVCEHGGRRAAGRSGSAGSAARRSSAGTRTIRAGRASAWVRSTAIPRSGRAVASSSPTPPPGRPSRTMACRAIPRARTPSRAWVRRHVPSA